MILGLDFDNTLVCYDRVFHAQALARGLVSPDTSASKEAVRDALRAAGRERDWTELQGWAYGPGMSSADPFPGVLNFLRRARAAGVALRIISHRTRRPILGEPHDLHAAAREWLKKKGFLSAEFGLSENTVFFEETKEAKLARIASEACTHFVDDLPEFLSEKDFPAGTERWLFDPSGRRADGPFPSGVSWEELACHLLPPDPGPLLKTAGLPSAEKIQALPGSGNNRVFRVTSSARAYALKTYFRHPDDPRDRLGAEYGFTRFCWEHGITRVPRPLAADSASGAALYEFVEGARVAPGSVGNEEIDQALDFFESLQAVRGKPGAETLPMASEACFSLGEHLSRVRERVTALGRVGMEGNLAREARAFCAGPLAAAWGRVESKARDEARRAGLEPGRRLEGLQRVLSPSDFGFHNALREAGGRLRFLDFEYAGWDDPAKLAADFFCQPAVPVPINFFDAFSRRVCSATSDPAGAAARARLLLPVYRIKWCAIRMNEFLPAGGARRRFSRGGADREERRRVQLEAARAALSAAEEALR